MEKYRLVAPIAGKELIELLQDTSQEFGYRIEVKALRDTFKHEDNLSWRLSGAGSFGDGNREYNGTKIKDVEPKVKSVLVQKVQGVDSWIKRAFYGDQKYFWTAESLLDEDQVYSAIPVELYKADAIAVSVSLHYVHYARAKPLRERSSGFGFQEIDLQVIRLVNAINDIIQSKNTPHQNK